MVEFGIDLGDGGGKAASMARAIARRYVATV
jgi:hypothetical protein